MYFSAFFLLTFTLNVHVMCFKIAQSAEVNDDILHFGRRLRGNVITTELVGDLRDCVKECIQRPRCMSVNFYLRFRLCEFNKITGNSSVLVEEKGSVYTEIDHWNKGIAGFCWNRTRCDMNEKCVPVRRGDDCIVSDCGDLHVIDGARYITNETIEIGLFTKIEYNCINGSLVDGDSKISCEENGKWSLNRMILNCQLDNPYSTSTAADSSTLTTNIVAESSPTENGFSTTTVSIPDSTQSTTTPQILDCGSATTDASWSCENATKALDIVFTLDDTSSIDNQEYGQQIQFFQTLTVRLANITTCVHVACYQHSDIAQLVFGFNDHDSALKTCQAIGGLARRNIEGDYETETVDFSLSQFNTINDPLSLDRTRIVLVVSDNTGNKWNSNQGRGVLDAAGTSEVSVVSINVENERSPVKSNHFTVNIASMIALDGELENIINVIRNRFTSA